MLVSAGEMSFRGTVTAIGILFLRLEPFELGVGGEFQGGQGAVLVRRSRIDWLQVL